jgi:hypothetical protein
MESFEKPIEPAGPAKGSFMNKRNHREVVRNPSRGNTSLIVKNSEVRAASQVSDEYL